MVDHTFDVTPEQRRDLAAVFAPYEERAATDGSEPEFVAEVSTVLARLSENGPELTLSTRELNFVNVAVAESDWARHDDSSTPPFSDAPPGTAQLAAQMVNEHDRATGRAPSYAEVTGPEAAAPDGLDDVRRVLAAQNGTRGSQSARSSNGERRYEPPAAGIGTGLER